MTKIWQTFWSQVWLWRSSSLFSITGIFPTILKILKMQDLSLFFKPIIWNFCLDWKSWPSLVCSARGGPLPWLVESVSSKLQCSNTGNSGNSDIDYITVTALPSTYQCPSTGPDLENMENIFLKYCKVFSNFRISLVFAPFCIFDQLFSFIFFFLACLSNNQDLDRTGWLSWGWLVIVDSYIQSWDWSQSITRSIQYRNYNP